MEQSAWYGQVGNRSVRDCAMMRSGEWTQTNEQVPPGHRIADTHMNSFEVGSRGSDVAAVQRVLGVRVDGDFGPKTEQAVRAFQVSHGIAADGIVGRETRANLDRLQTLGNPEYHAGTPNTHQNPIDAVRQTFDDIGKAVASVEQFAAIAEKTVVTKLEISLPEVAIVAEGPQQSRSRLEAFRDGKIRTIGNDFSQTGKLHDFGTFVAQTTEIDGRPSVTMFPKNILFEHTPASERAGLTDAIEHYKTITWWAC